MSVSQENTTATLSSKGAEAINVSSLASDHRRLRLVLPATTPTIDPNETVTLHFSRDTDTDSDIYLGQAPELLVKSMQPGMCFVLVSLQGEIASIYHLQDLRSGGSGAARRPRGLNLPGTVGRLCRPTVPEKKDSWRAFALQTSHQRADCVSPVTYHDPKPRQRSKHKAVQQQLD